jgi:hypothetical protein
LWEVVAYPTSSTAKFQRDTGEALYRRSLYTFWKRTAPPPSMQILDGPSREACVVRRERTNTSAAALLLMNDEQFVEAARLMAQRVLQAEGASDDERLTFAFQLATARAPRGEQRAVLEQLLARARLRFQADAESARQLISVGESAPAAQTDPAELAAWTLVANTILNMDEVLSQR